MATINTEAIRQALILCIGENIPVILDGDPIPFAIVPGLVSGACTVTFDVRSVQSNGVDDVRHTYRAGTNDLTQEHYADRIATLTIKIESDQREEAFQTTERIRTRMRFDAQQLLLKAANISLADFLGSAQVNGKWDNRQISVHTLDWRLNIGVQDFDTPVETIDTVNTNNVVPAVPKPAP